MEQLIKILVNFTATGLTQMTTDLTALNAQMTALRTNQKAVTTNMNNQAAATKKMGEAAGQAAGNVGKLNNNMQNAGKSTRKAKGLFADFGKQLVNTALFLAKFAIVIGVFKTLELAIVGTAKAAAQFQAALFDLQAIANVSNDELERLRELTLDVAGSTRFTAAEIVSLEKALARLGFSTSQIAESTESIARFAEATGESAEAVAEFVGKQLKAFQLATIQTTELVNAYTTAINNSALNLETLATSSQYASSISRSLGITFKEQNALLATLADNGLTASRAGTGLRKILIELGAEGGSLIPILNELAKEGLSLAEAEELVGDRAAGALIALVSQTDAVSNLVEMQESMSAVLIASSRQNASFNGQVDAMRAAVNKLAIGLGDWITKTKIILNLIEKFGGGTKPRGFTFLQSLGLTGEEVDELIANADEITAIANVYRDNIEEIREMGPESVAGASFNLLTALGIDPSGMTAKELYEVYADADALISLIQEYADDTKRRNNILSEAETMSSNFQASIKGEADSYMLIGKEIQRATERIFEYRNTARELTEAEENQIAILEAYIEKLRQANIVKDEEIGLDEKSIDSFEAINKLYEQLAEAISSGDYAREQYIKSQIIENEELLESLGLYDKYIYYLNETIRKEDELVRKRLDKEREERANQSVISEGERLLTSLLFSVQSGESDPRAAADLAFGYLDGVASEFGEDSKYYKDLQKKVFSFTDLFFEGDETGGGLTEEQQFAAQQLARFGSFLNDQMLDATNRRLEAEQAAIDARYSYEEDRLNGFLAAGIISQEQYERDRLRLEKERVQKTNEIERKRFNAEKANSLAQIAIQTALGIASAGGDIFKIALIAGIATAQAAIVAAQRFQPTKFAQGGKVEGASHEQGGVPFTVQGRGGYEMEGGEYIINKKATGAFLPLLEQINSFGKGNIPAKRMAFANGGIIPQGASSEFDTQGAIGGEQKLIAYIQEENLIARSNTRITNDIRKRL